MLVFVPLTCLSGGEREKGRERIKNVKQWGGKKGRGKGQKTRIPPSSLSYSFLAPCVMRSGREEEKIIEGVQDVHKGGRRGGDGGLMTRAESIHIT